MRKALLIASLSLLAYPSAVWADDITNGVKGLVRQGQTGTVNENAARQLKQLDQEEAASRPKPSPSPTPSATPSTKKK